MGSKWAAAAVLCLATVVPAHADILGLGGKCLDVRNKKVMDGAAVVLNACDNGSSQEWTPIDGKLVGPEGLCLDIMASGSASPAAVVGACKGAESQRWSLDQGRISGPGGKCLEARGDPESEAIPVVVERCRDTAGQRWIYN